MGLPCCARMRSRLFADRAAAANPGFALGPGNVNAVASICRAVDGLPLGIELAAAWVRVLTVEQIAARLTDRFRLLSSAERMVPARHRTLRSAIDWSHELLSAPERMLLRRLSVFAGWPLEMAEQVCAGLAPGEDLAAGEIFGLLAGLADKSLVIAEPEAAGRIRYRMLDTIRDYAAERLRRGWRDGATARAIPRLRGARGRGGRAARHGAHAGHLGGPG